MRYEYLFNWKSGDFEYKIEGHKEDDWNVDMLLAPLILHLLKKVKEQKLGTPIVSNVDVPEEMWFDISVDRWTTVEYEKNEKQWDWIIDEMIYAFDSIANLSDVDFPDKETDDRVQNGTTLFGKYFQNLWT